MNPYQILEINSNATDDEVKKAYRALSKKYHPDANINNPNQALYTEKFKQVQNAYKQIMDQRKSGQSFSNSSSQGYTNQNQYQGYSGHYTLNEAYGFIQARRYQEALNILNQIRQRNGQWFYFAAICENALGNKITAMEYAQAAVNLEPGNIQYILFLNQIQGRQQQYHTQSQGYGNPMGNMGQCCYQIMMVNCMLNFCCGINTSLLCC